jgi:ribonuclease HI
MKILYAAKLEFQCTNYIAEYEAMLLGLRKLKVMGVKHAILKSDSQVILGHVDKSNKVKRSSLDKYLEMVQRMECSIEGFYVKNIPRADDEHAEWPRSSLY